MLIKNERLGGFWPYFRQITLFYSILFISAICVYVCLLWVSSTTISMFEWESDWNLFRHIIMWHNIPDLGFMYRVCLILGAISLGVSSSHILEYGCYDIVKTMESEQLLENDARRFAILHALKAQAIAFFAYSSLERSVIAPKHMWNMPVLDLIYWHIPHKTTESEIFSCNLTALQFDCSALMW